MIELNKLCKDNGDTVVGRQAIVLAQKLNYKRGIAQALNNIGVIYYKQQKGRTALDNHFQALAIRQGLGNKKDISASYTNIGNSYDLLGDKKQAIEFHRKSLEIKVELKDTLGMARSLNNIASAYNDIPDYYKVIEYGFKAVNLFQAMGDTSDNYAQVLNNIGLAYEHLEGFDKSLEYYHKALSIYRELEDDAGIAQMLNNMGNVYLLQGQKAKGIFESANKFQSALQNYFKALDILIKTDDKYLTAVVYNNIGNVYWELNKIGRASCRERVCQYV